MKNIGIVCEGPTDYILLKAIIDKITGEANTYFQLQPEDNLQGEYGNGWKGVWKWCMEHEQNLERFMKDITPQLDMLVVHMDGDVARNEKEVHCQCEATSCELKNKIHPLKCTRIKKQDCPIVLPCENHEQSVNGYEEHLTALILKWLNQNDNVCVGIPCDSIEAWVVAAYDSLQGVESIENPWMRIISKGKEYHGIRIQGHKKRLTTYRQFVGRVCEQWEQIKILCTCAARFEENIRSCY